MKVLSYSGDLYWGDKLAFSVVFPPSLPSVCLSSFLVSGVKTVQCIRTKFSGWIDPSGGRVILYFSGVHDARGTCRRVKACTNIYPTLQAKQEAPPTPNLQVTRIQPQRVCFLWLPFLWGAGCTRQGRKKLL